MSYRDFCFYLKGLLDDRRALSAATVGHVRKLLESVLTAPADTGPPPFPTGSVYAPVLNPPAGLPQSGMFPKAPWVEGPGQ